HVRGGARAWQPCNCRPARSCIRMARSGRAAEGFPPISRGMALGLPRHMASGAAPAVERAAETAENVIVGKYETLEEMGASPVGTTHKVRHALLDTVLSMTVLSPEVSGDPYRLGLVQAAVQQACRLRHEHIAPVLDFGQ